MSSSRISRRHFFGQSSMALAGVVMAPRLHAEQGVDQIVLPAPSTRGAARALSTFVRPAFDPDTLRALAREAIVAALHAGADWADIRIGDRRTYAPSAAASLSIMCGFGVRVRVKGAEAFVGGTDPVPERLAAAAQSAVMTARELAGAMPAGKSFPALAPVPVVTGEWAAPCQIDPFSISVDDHAALFDGSTGVHDGRFSRWRNRGFGAPGNWWQWIGETRVYASSEGSLVTQHQTGLNAQLVVEKGGEWRLQHDDFLELIADRIHAQTGGVELVLRPEWKTDIEATMEELARYATVPGGVMDVGRHPVVLSGTVHAELMSRTLLPALSLNRVLGNELELSGLSFLTPPSVHMDDLVCSPLISYAVDGPGTHFGARQWDDEGVTVTRLPLIEHGRLINYFASRATAPTLSRIHPGTVSAPLAGVTQSDLASPPAALPPAVSLAPSPTTMSLDALVRRLETGVLMHGGGVSINPDGSGGYINKNLMLEIRGGRIVRRIRGARLAFSTKRMLQTLVALGDVSTVRTLLNRNIVPGVPWTFPPQAQTAPAALYSAMDVVPNTLHT